MYCCHHFPHIYFRYAIGICIIITSTLPIQVQIDCYCVRCGMNLKRRKKMKNSIELMNKRKNGIKLIPNCSTRGENNEALPPFSSALFFLNLPVFLWKILWFRIVYSRMTIKQNPETKRKRIFFLRLSFICLPAFFRKWSKTNNEKWRRERQTKNESICTDSKRIKWRERFSTSTSFRQHRLVQSEIVLIRRRIHDPVHGKYWMKIYSQKSNTTTKLKKDTKGPVQTCIGSFFGCFWAKLHCTLYNEHCTVP